jgi:ATP-dependent Clp protease ATP-binding subunit ClpC
LKSALVEAQRRGEKYLGPELVVSAAEEKVNIPIHEAGGEETTRLLKLEEIIHERLVDQEEAVKAVADSLREYRSGLARAGGPIANFLFVGPTGVGKTELAKILAAVQFGSEKAMVRFDMTEYQDKQSFYRFIGSPDGSTSGALTDAILQKPYSLILLDEFEKAFPDILNLFLQVFDDGRLTDNLGRTVDFTNTIIIATSNAHSDIINEALNNGESMTDITEYLKKKLVDVFKPELLNRFSRIVVFKNLEPADLEKIVILNLKELSSAVSAQGIKIEFDPAAIKQLVKLGYDPAYGARPLRRVIDEKIRAPLAQEILRRKITRGGGVKLILSGEDFEFVSTEG